MILQELLHQRREELRAAIRDPHGSPMYHSDAFIARVLGVQGFATLRPDSTTIDPHLHLSSGQYQGYPWVAAVGFTLGSTQAIHDPLAKAFLEGLNRLQQRTGQAQEILASDDIALLGIADGFARISGQTDERLATARTWLLHLLYGFRQSQTWSSRMRDVAGDLLDGRGRLHVQLDTQNVRTFAPEVVLRAMWPHPFHRVPPLDQLDRERLAKLLLTQRDIPHEPEEAAIWLRCLDILVDEASTSLVTSYSDTVRILMHIQHGLKRWVWRDKARRRNTLPSRWQIDDEYDVQSLLWTVLYPIYGSALVDEQYLPGWGHVQPRADLGITSLKLIIEVKIARDAAAFADIEEQVAGDIGLYFKDPILFDHMVVFIYDDCDKPHPEKYESLRAALKGREKIEEVVIIRRPSMLPNRGDRNG